VVTNHLSVNITTQTEFVPNVKTFQAQLLEILTILVSVLKHALPIARPAHIIVQVSNNK